MDNDLQQLLNALIRNTKIASLGTSNNNEPYVSMVSFSVSENNNEFYILTSNLATHTKNFKSNPNVSLLICQPENISKNPQSLARVAINGTIKLIPKDGTDFIEIKDNYITKNPTAAMYFDLEDFNLYRIIMKEARYVAGFGKVYSLSKI